MLPRIQAEEQIMAISAMALGGGKVERREAKRAIERLERIAGGGRREARKVTPDLLAAMGIAVVQAAPSGDQGASAQETSGETDV